MVKQAERSAATTGAILLAARTLFRKYGYDAVSIDDIAEKAGCKKGAVYHHFDSKQAIFERVVDDLQAAIAADLTAASSRRTSSAPPVRQMAQSFQAYVKGSNHPDNRQILLIDGPMVLGWQRWREIDDRHFAGMVRSGLSRLMSDASPATIEAATRLTLGAIMEASIACAIAPDPSEAASKYLKPFELMLSGFALQAKAAARSD